MMKGSMSPVLVNIGFGNVVAAEKVVAIVTPGSAPMKRIREEAKKSGKLVDATGPDEKDQGRSEEIRQTG
jgi:regulator of extracellular matrix RemA (YlzA/DUF370 family)